MFHKGRRINTTDTLLAIKKPYIAKIVHVSASVCSDGSTAWLRVRMNGVILHEYCVYNLPVQVVTFHLHMQMEEEPFLTHKCILVSQAACMYAITVPLCKLHLTTLKMYLR